APRARELGISAERLRADPGLPKVEPRQRPHRRRQPRPAPHAPVAGARAGLRVRAGRRGAVRGGGLVDGGSVQLAPGPELRAPRPGRTGRARAAPGALTFAPEIPWPLGKTMTDDPIWFKDAIFYELRIPSFYDSDNDGIGDVRGRTEKLDYLHDLGVTTLWLLPFYPSPLRDDGYDTADYMTVHPVTGTLRDFKTFLKEAHRRGLKVVTELVLNHTSDQPPWILRARPSPPGSKWRDFYVWSDNPRKWPEARIIFQDFETS